MDKIIQTHHFSQKSPLRLKKSDYLPLVRLSLEEDQAQNDVTTKAIFPRNEEAVATIFAKEKGIMAGGGVARTTFETLDGALHIRIYCKEGEEFTKGRELVRVQGDIRSILGAERTALNFLSFMSGIATLSREVSQKLSSWGIGLLDTRKTVPGQRMLSKYAVNLGGGGGRLHLAEQGLIKDNHIHGHGSLRNSVLIFKRKHPDLFCQVEVENDEQLKEALLAQPDGILLDNMKPRKILRCVRKIKRHSRRIKKQIYMEASGGYHPKNIRSLKKTGIDHVSMSSITMNARPIDLNLEINHP